MRYLLRNCIRDRTMDRRRAANPGKATLRPIIAGKVLPPASIRIMLSHDITQPVLAEIELHQNAGNVQLLRAGRGGGEVDLVALRKELGWSQLVPAPEVVSPVFLPSAVEALPLEPVSPTVTTEVVTAVETEVATEVVVSPPVIVEPLLPPEAPAPVLDELLGDTTASEDTEQAPPETIGYKAALFEKSNEELRVILIGLGGAATGKRKSVLVEEILERTPASGV